MNPVSSQAGPCDVGVSPTIETRSSCERETSSSSSTSENVRAVPRVVASNRKVNCETIVGVSNSEWQVVRNKSSKRYKLIGQKGCATPKPDSKFKAADVQVPLLISNVSKDTSEDDIVTYIRDKTSEIVTLKIINMTKVKKYNAYKLYVSKSKLGLFLDDNFWPDGITFRRFVRFTYRTKPENLVKVNKQQL